MSNIPENWLDDESAMEQVHQNNQTAIERFRAGQQLPRLVIPGEIKLPKVKSMDQMLAEAKAADKPEMAARIAAVMEAMVKADEDYARSLDALAAKYSKHNNK